MKIKVKMDLYESGLCLTSWIIFILAFRSGGVNSLPYRTSTVSHLDTGQTGQIQHECKGIRSRRHAQISNPPNIAGIWYSPRCEVVPGPQYILRKYQFASQGKFTINRYYFMDEMCSTPSHGIQARGTIRADSESWLLSEGTEMVYDVEDIQLLPYSHHMINILHDIINYGCVNYTGTFSDSLFTQQPITISPKDFNCLDSLTFTTNELLIMRQVSYAVKHPSVTAANPGRSMRDLNKPGVEKELQLGGVWLSQRYPSSYQPPLYSYSHKHCEACVCINKSTFDKPPSNCVHHVVSQSADNVPVSGSWFSMNCESVRNALFTLRTYEFDPVLQVFRMATHYYKDPYCQDPSFSIYASGSYDIKENHRNLLLTQIYEIRILTLQIQLLSSHMVKLMNLGRLELCGNITNWELSTLEDVSSTRGCDTLGVSYREREYVLAKIEHHKHRQFLTVSDSKQDMRLFYTQITTFQPVLKQCAKKPIRWTSNTLSRSDNHNNRNNSSYYNSASDLQAPVIIHILVMYTLVFHIL